LQRLFPLFQVDVQEVNGELTVISRAQQAMHWELDLIWEVPTLSLEDFRCNKFRQETAWAFQYNYSDLSNGNILQFVEALATTGVDAVSDGSPKAEKGAAAWIIQYTTNQLAGAFKVASPPDAQDAYRCELGGMLAILAVVRAAIKIFHLQKARLNEACDGESALERVFNNDRPSSFNDSQRDIIFLIQQHLNAMPQLSLGWLHVYGHQDDDPYAELSIWARWNILMDHRAKLVRAAVGVAYAIPGSQQLWTVKIDGQEILRQTVNVIRNHCVGTAAKVYWANKQGGIGEVSPDEVDWDSLGIAMQETDSERRRWITKHTTGWCGVNKNMVRWKFAVIHNCPRCGRPQEDASHVWTCPSQSARKVWEAAEKDLPKWMKRHKTNPQIAKVISSRLRSWRANTRADPLNFTNFPGLRMAVRAQDRMDWKAAFEGRWHLDWAAVQQKYYEYIGSRRTGKRWLVAVIKKLWEVAWDLWIDRNGQNIRLKEQRARILLEQQVSAEYLQGYQLLHLRKRRLLTQFTLEERLGMPDQALGSWLLRVASARRWAELDPEQVQRDLAELAQRVQRQRRQVAAQRQHENMQQLLSRWLQGGPV
jgi:hypothetical protein